MSVKRLKTQLGDVVVQMTRIRVSSYFPPEGWHPAINAYQLAGSLEVCVDLAGVDPSLIDVTVRGGRLFLRGHRNPPVPERGQPVRIVAMEIDCGRFERELPLPPEVDAARVRAEHRNGFLWIHLPFKPGL